MRDHADVDPNAPPAMKASPSVSGDDAGTYFIYTKSNLRASSCSPLLFWDTSMYPQQKANAA